jgi:hypothetical protein
VDDASAPVVACRTLQEEPVRYVMVPVNWRDDEYLPSATASEIIVADGAIDTGLVDGLGRRIIRPREPVGFRVEKSR